MLEFLCSFQPSCDFRLRDSGGAHAVMVCVYEGNAEALTMILEGCAGRGPLANNESLAAGGNQVNNQRDNFSLFHLAVEHETLTDGDSDGLSDAGDDDDDDGGNISQKNNNNNNSNSSSSNNVKVLNLLKQYVRPSPQNGWALDVNCALYSTGATPLYVACEKGRTTEVIELLLRLGADVQATTVDGHTPLHCVRFREYVFTWVL